MCTFRENTPSPIILRTNPRRVTEPVIMNVCSPCPARTCVFLNVGVQFRKPTWQHRKWSPFLGHIVIHKADGSPQYCTTAVDAERPNMFLSSKADSNLSASRGLLTAQRDTGRDVDLGSSWGWRRMGPEVPAERERETARESERERERG